MAQYILDFIGITSTELAMLTLSDVLKVIIFMYTGLYALRIVMSFISSVFPSGKNSVFRGL